MSEREKWALLAGLTLVWVGLFTFQIATEPEPQRTPLTYKSGHEPRGHANQPLTLKKALLAQGRQLDFETPKNIFATLDLQGITNNLKQSESPPVQKKAPVRVSKPVITVSPVETLPSPTPPPTAPTISAAQQAAQKASRQLAEYRFLGYLMQHGTALAFIEKGREVYIVKIGDLLNNTIEVKMIDPTHVKLVDARTAVEATILLLTQQDVAHAS